MGGLIKLALVAALIAMIVINAPDIKRYVKISRM
jgi:hypothetical protein